MTPPKEETVEDAQKRKSNSFFVYNLPLQLWPNKGEDDDESGDRILNYMPRREGVTSLQLADVLNGQTREDFLEQTALVLENLARLFREAKTDPTKTVYYPDAGMDLEAVNE